MLGQRSRIAKFLERLTGRIGNQIPNASSLLPQNTLDETRQSNSSAWAQKMVSVITTPPNRWFGPPPFVKSMYFVSQFSLSSRTSTRCWTPFSKAVQQNPQNRDIAVRKWPADRKPLSPCWQDVPFATTILRIIPTTSNPFSGLNLAQ